MVTRRPHATRAVTRPVIHLIPHTHWDREWYLPRSAFQARLPAIVSDVLDQLEADESLRFLLDGQTVVAEDYLDLCPDERARVERLALTGRLQLGPWYVLADQMMPSGEALIRNLLTGTASARALGADPMPVAYAPDAFGHPQAVPTIAVEFGLSHAVVWRGIDVPWGTMGEDLFRWRAPDGATVLAYHLPRAGYEVGMGLSARRETLDREWPAIRTELLGRAVCRHVALFVGADHHAMRSDLAALREALATADPGCDFRISSLMEFFRAVDREAPTAPVCRGELRRSPGYAWALQGVHGTRLPIKRANAALELLLERDVEPLVALAPGVAEHRTDLVHAAWRLVLQNQFHDSLAGTVSDGAFREITGRFARARDLACRAASDAIDELVGHDPDAPAVDPEHVVLVWNPAARPRSAVVVTDLVTSGRPIPVGPPASNLLPEEPPVSPPAGIALEDGQGEILGVQVLHRRSIPVRSDGRCRYPRLTEAAVTRIAFRAESLPGCALSRFRLVEREARLDGNGVQYHGGRLANRFVSLAVETDGSFTLADCVRKRTYRRLLAVRHESDMGDAYTVHRPASGPRLVRVGAVERRGEGGPVLGWLRARYGLRRREEEIGVTLLASLDRDSPVVRWTVTLDNGARDHRVLADLPLGLPGTLLVGTAFGSLERGAEPKVFSAEALERPGPTAPAHRYVARAAEDGGLAVFQAGSFEYEWSGEGNLSLTLLRAIGQLSRPDLPERPGHAAWPTTIPEAQCLGRHDVHIAVMPIGDDAREPGRLQELWEDAIVSPWGRCLEIAPREHGACPSPFGSITLEGPGLAFSTCKPAASGEGVVLRCWNEADTVVDGAWSFERPVRRATLCRADERPVESLTVEDAGRRIAFAAAARAVVTIVVA